MVADDSWGVPGAVPEDASDADSSKALGPPLISGEDAGEGSHPPGKGDAVVRSMATVAADRSRIFLLPGTDGRVRPLLTSQRSQLPDSSTCAACEATSPTAGAPHGGPRAAARAGPGHLQSRWKGARGNYNTISVILGIVVACEVSLSVFREAVLFLRLGEGCDGDGATLVGADEGGLCRALDLYWTVTVPGAAKQVLGSVVLWLAHELQCHKIRSYRKLLLQERRVEEHASAGARSTRSRTRQERNLERVAGHWTHVASKDIYRGTAATIVDIQFLVASALLLAVLTAFTSQIRALLFADNGEKPGASQALSRYATSNCCPSAAGDAGTAFEGECSELCLFGISWIDAILTGTTGLLGCLMCTTAFIPCKLWSPLTSVAMRKTEDFQLGRVLILPVVVSVLCVLNGIGLLQYVLIKLSGDSIVFPVLVWEIFAVFATVILIIELCVIVWCLGVTQIATVILHLLSFVLSSVGRLLHPGHRVHPHGHKPQASWSRLWRCSQSWRYRQLVLLFVCIYTYSIEVTDGMLVYELWAARIVVLVLLLTARDELSDFETLNVQGAGFGLLVDAKDLRAALCAHMAGTDYTGPVRKYKGTILRMEDTMAVSYRWNEANSQLIKYGRSGAAQQQFLCLNMSEWQTSALVDAINRTKCLYVWLDVCSVPQNNIDLSKLKRTLLARMMAVYASAFVSLILLSGEPDGERYHQRTWTLQEYCASQRLMIKEEDETSLEDGIFAVYGSEGTVVEQLRREHMKRQPWSTPVWLAPSVESLVKLHSSGNAHRIRHTYEALSSSLACRYPVDSIRALYPLLWNAPAESEDELIGLVISLQEVHGIHQEKELRLLSDDSNNFDTQQELTRSSTGNIGLTESLLNSLPAWVEPEIGTQTEAAGLLA